VDSGRGHGRRRHGRDDPLERLISDAIAAWQRVFGAKDGRAE
jgi:hypothetical protein